MNSANALGSSLVILQEAAIAARDVVGIAVSCAEPCPSPHECAWMIRVRLIATCGPGVDPSCGLVVVPTMRGRKCCRSGGHRSVMRRGRSRECPRRAPRRSREAVLVADLVALSIPIRGRSSHDGAVRPRGRVRQASGGALGLGPDLGVGVTPSRARGGVVSGGWTGTGRRPSRRKSTSAASRLAPRTAAAWSASRTGS